MQGSPAFAAYAASDAPALPDDAVATSGAPMRRAWDTAMQEKRSLCDQVGLRLSSLE